jgi:HTH-type transcriptional regulator, cell division transcriptional repressor
VRKRANWKNVVGIRVAEARNRRNPPLTQDALSGKLAALGVQLDRAAIAKIENGHRRIYDFEVQALAKALSVRIDWLFGGD